MSESKMMGARVPLAWAEQIEAIAAETGITASDVCREALGKYLGKRSSSGAKLAQRVSTLEKQIKTLQTMVLNS